MPDASHVYDFQFSFVLFCLVLFLMEMKHGRRGRKESLQGSLSMGESESTHAYSGYLNETEIKRCMSAFLRPQES